LKGKLGFPSMITSLQASLVKLVLLIALIIVELKQPGAFYTKISLLGAIAVFTLITITVIYSDSNCVKVD